MFRSLAVLFFVSFSAIAAQAQSCSPIQFGAGESGALVDGLLPAEGRDCYTLDVSKGQNVFISVVGGSQNVAVSVINVGDARRTFDFTATSNRVEFIVFQLMRSVTSADYSLHIQVK